jgi:hypothetical protein
VAVVTVDLFSLPDHEDRQVCAEPAACVVCELAPLDGESRADFLARLRTVAREQIGDEVEDCCVNGHPWTEATTGWQRDNDSRRRICLVCRQNAQRRYREKHAAAGHQRCSRCKVWRAPAAFDGERLTCTVCALSIRARRRAVRALTAHLEAAG